MRIICVDDERIARKNFEELFSKMSNNYDVKVFSEPEEVLEWVEKHPVDIVFADIEMRGMNGIELAAKLKQMDNNIRIIFTTAYGEYALDAFGVDALGYLLKPYTQAQLQAQLEKAELMRSKPQKRVKIQTIPGFAITVDGEVVNLSGKKKRELLALLVDRADAGVTMGEAISCLWPERLADKKTQTLYRVTFHQMMEELKMLGIEWIIRSVGRKHYIVKEELECDLYHILEGGPAAMNNYAGYYLYEYSWAEVRNAQLYEMWGKKKRI